MAETVTATADGSMFWYELGPANLAVHTSREHGHGITLSWKGEMQPEDLRHCFKSVAWRVSKHRDQSELFWRAWVVTDDGPQVMKDPWDDYLISSSEFVQFESLPEPPRNEELGQPVLAVFSNQDRRANKPEEAQDFIGLFLSDPADVTLLRAEIAAMVAQTRSRFFKDGSYSQDSALKRLEEVSADLKLPHLSF